MKNHANRIRAINESYALEFVFNTSPKVESTIIVEDPITAQVVLEKLRAQENEKYLRAQPAFGATPDLRDSIILSLEIEKDGSLRCTVRDPFQIAAGRYVISLDQVEVKGPRFVHISEYTPRVSSLRTSASACG